MTVRERPWLSEKVLDRGGSGAKVEWAGEVEQVGTVVEQDGER